MTYFCIALTCQTSVMSCSSKKQSVRVVIVLSIATMAGTITTLLLVQGAEALVEELWGQRIYPEGII